MSSVNWASVLQNAKPTKGFSALPAGQYRFRILSGQGKTAGTGSEMIAVQMEVISAGPANGRKVFTNFVLPTGQNDTDPDKIQDRVNRFLGDMEAFGLPGEWFAQLWSASGPTKETCDYVGQTLVNRTCKATATLQRDDASRNNFNNFETDDGVDPPPPAAKSSVGPGAIAPAPVMPGVPSSGAPGMGMPQPQAPGVMPGAPAAAAPPVPPAAPPAAPPVAAAVPAPPMPGMPGTAAGAPPQAPPAAPPAPPVAPPAPGGYAAPPAAPQMPGMPAAPSASF